MNTQTTSVTTGAERRARNLLLLAMRRILRPLVRLLLDHDIKYNMILEELKRVYVRVAEEEFKLSSRPQTDSRITLLTGVHRKDVRRLRSERSDAQPETRNHSLSSQVMDQWLRNPLYVDKNNRPLPLARLASASSEKSFEALVAGISKDFRARPLLDEWLNLGMVRLDNQDYVHLEMHAFTPNQALEEKLFYLSINLHDHLAAAVNNINLKNTPYLEQSIYCDNLTAENIEKLHSAAKEMSAQSLNSLAQLAKSLKSTQLNLKETKLKRISYGVYFHSASDAIKMDHLHSDKHSDNPSKTSEA